MFVLRVFASLSSKCRSEYTSAVSFQTKSCEPEQPQPPKQTSAKKKNEISLRWSACNDNGSKIINYILEYREFRSKTEDSEAETSIKNNGDEQTSQDTFIQVYKGPLKQFIVKKLTPSTCYAFRLAAENAHGLSEFSKIALAYTSGCVPNAPEPPDLVEASTNSLTLSWDAKNDLEYELQMIDIENPVSVAHGFLAVYNGPLGIYKVTELKRFSSYQFRVRFKEKFKLKKN